MVTWQVSSELESIMADYLDHNPDLPISLRNNTCIYCGNKFDKQRPRTREHVIGTSFVPGGTLGKQWNLIAWACESCNNKKSCLEDDLSAISMQPDAWGHFADNDERLLTASRRKAEKSFSRKTRQLVGKSLESTKLSVSLGLGVDIHFEFTAPPQPDRERVLALAFHHIQAFFYFITFNKKTREGGFIPGCFVMAMDVIRSDWGNPIMRSFADNAKSWNVRMLAIGADGFFKVMIKRHPDELKIWKWAVEWNKNIRAIGFFGDDDLVNSAIGSLPSLGTCTIQQSQDSWTRYRKEEPLSPEEDILFIHPL